MSAWEAADSADEEVNAEDAELTDGGADAKAEQIQMQMRKRKGKTMQMKKLMLQSK